ncbi:MAG: hypothetical protein QJR00_02720 [Bacillota bacterium]|nr:hypothetical protein [Bacillota bacterium]
MDMAMMVTGASSPQGDVRIGTKEGNPPAADWLAALLAALFQPQELEGGLPAGSAPASPGKGLSPEAAAPDEGERAAFPAPPEVIQREGLGKGQALFNDPGAQKAEKSQAASPSGAEGAKEPPVSRPLAAPFPSRVGFVSAGERSSGWEPARGPGKIVPMSSPPVLPGPITLPVIRGPELPAAEEGDGQEVLASKPEPQTLPGKAAGPSPEARPEAGAAPTLFPSPGLGFRDPARAAESPPSSPEISPEVREEPEVGTAGILPRGEGQSWRGQVAAGSLGTLDIEVELKGAQVGARVEGQAEALQWLRDAVKELEVGLQQRGFALSQVDWVPQGSGGSAAGSGAFHPSAGGNPPPFHQGGDGFQRRSAGEGLTHPRRGRVRGDGVEWRM